MKPKKKATSARAKFMNQQLEAKKTGNKSGILGKDISKKFNSDKYVPPEAKSNTPKGKT